jgi:hypothetical protein
MRRVRAAAVTAAACLLLAACGRAEEPRTPILRTPVSLAPATPQPTPGTARPSLGTPPPDRTVGPAKPVTVTGTVAEGVEAGCLVLGRYLLIGGRGDGVRAGAKVTVTGRAQPDLVTTCQQGTPLLVETVRPG